MTWSGFGDAGQEGRVFLGAFELFCGGFGGFMGGSMGVGEGGGACGLAVGWAGGWRARSLEILATKT